MTKLNTMGTSRGLAAAIAAAALAVALAWLAFAGSAQAQSGGSISVDPASQNVEPGGTASVSIMGEAPDDNLGAWDISVSYDADVLEFTGCDTDTSTSCDGSQGSIQIAGIAISAAGLEGTVNLGTINFSAIGDDGTSSDVSISVTDWADAGANPVTPAINDGSITVATPTASPEPSPTDDDDDDDDESPTATAGELPDTGGSVGTSSTDTMAWVLAAAGLTIVAGAAWTVARARREI